MCVDDFRVSHFYILSLRAVDVRGSNSDISRLFSGKHSSKDHLQSMFWCRCSDGHIYSLLEVFLSTDQRDGPK